MLKLSSKKKLGIGQPNVNGQILSKLPIHLPKSIESQKQLFQEIDSHFSAIGNLEETVNNVLIKQEHLRKSILKRGFEGQLVPQDPSDEPAEILLEGIKNEKGKYEQMRLT
jgi:type I restriction enzyme S subunit